MDFKKKKETKHDAGEYRKRKNDRLSDGYSNILARNTEPKHDFFSQESVLSKRVKASCLMETLLALFASEPSVKSTTWGNKKYQQLIASNYSRKAKQPH